jgi:hypothetical protein
LATTENIYFMHLIADDFSINLKPKLFLDSL